MNSNADGSRGGRTRVGTKTRPSPFREGAKALAPASAVLAVALIYVLFLARYVNCENTNVCRPAGVTCLLADNNLCHASFDEWFAAAREATADKEAEKGAKESPPAAKDSEKTTENAERPTAPPAPTPAPHVLTENEYQSRILPARLWWLHVTSLNLIVFPLALFVGSYLIRKSLAPGRRLKVLLPALALGAAAASVSLYLLGRRPPPVIEVLYCTVAADVSDAIFLSKLPVGLAYATIVVLVCASCVIAWPGRDDLIKQEAIEKMSDARRHAAAARLASRMNDLRTLLYTGTAALVAAVLRMSAASRWADSFLPTGDAGRAWVTKLIDDITSATSSVEAGTYTLLLAAVYIPPVLALRARARRLAKEKCTEEGRERPCTREGREEWLKSEGLLVSFSEYLPRVVAILGPLLAGPLGDLLARVAGK